MRVLCRAVIDVVTKAKIIQSNASVLRNFPTLPSILSVINNVQSVDVFLNISLFGYLNAKDVDNSKPFNQIVRIMIRSFQGHISILYIYTAVCCH